MNIFKRMAIVPFEIAVAVLAFISGVTGFAKVGVIDPVNQLLPAWEAIILNASLMLTGVLIVLGVAKAEAVFEAPGLWLLNGTILARLLLFGYYLHYGGNFAVTGVFNLAIILAGITRLRTIRARHVLVKVNSDETTAGS